jgi:hypothetical protein
MLPEVKALNRMLQSRVRLGESLSRSDGQIGIKESSYNKSKTSYADISMSLFERRS